MFGNYLDTVRARAGQLLHFESVPFSLVHFVSNKCNFRCRHCFIHGDFDHSEEDPRYVGEPLRLDEIEALAKSLRKRLGMVSLTGGEPFLRQDLADISRLYAHWGGARIVAISTNGFFTAAIGEFTQRFLAETDKRLYIMLSFDGPPSIHDQNRRCPGAFDKAVETARVLQQIGSSRIQVAATITVLDQETADMRDLFDYLVEDVGIKAITTAAVRGNVTTNGSVGFNAAAHRLLNQRIREYTLSNRIKPLDGFLFGDILNARGFLSRKRVEETCQTRKYIAPCTAGRVMVVVHADGSVYPCELRHDKIGSLRDAGMDLPLLMRTPRARQIRRAILRSKCFCSYECAWSVNVLFQPCNWGSLTREYVNLKTSRWRRG